MRRGLVGLGLLFAALLLAGCGSNGDGGASEGGGDDGGSGGGASSGTGDGDDSGTVDRDELSFLAVTPAGVTRVGVESGKATEVTTRFDLELGTDEMLTLPRLNGGVLWLATGPGRLIGIDAESGAFEQEIAFEASSITTDYAFHDGVVWVLDGFEWADAVLLAVDDATGEVLFTVEPPEFTTIGAMRAGDEGVWLIGGDPDSSTAVSRVDETSGVLAGTFDTGVVAQYLAVGAGGVWAGGRQPSSDGSLGDAVARLDPVSGELLATIEIGDAGSSIASIIEYRGAIWVTDVIGPDGAGAQLHRIDPASNAITDTFDVGGSGYGSLNLVSGGGYLLAVNSIDRETYLINVETLESEGILVGSAPPAVIP